MKRTHALAVLLLLAALLPWAGARAQSAVPLTEDFETPAAGAPLPDGWSDASFGELRASATLDSRKPKEGKSSLRLAVAPWNAGAGRVRRSGVALKGQTPYSLEVWLRGMEVTAPVEVAVRKPDGAVYFGERLAVGADWRRYRIQGSAPEDDAAAAVEISLPCSGTLWIDALRLVPGELPVEPELPVPAPRPGNRIFNSSFELGTDGWTIAEQVALVKNSCPDGEQFARLLPNPYPLQARPFLARAGARYTVSAYMRSQRPGAKAEVALVEVGGSARLSQKFDLSAEWRRYSFQAVTPCREFPRYFLQLGPAEEQHGLDVDAVQVEEGPLADFAPSAPVEITHGLARAQLFPEPNAVLGLPCQLYAPGKTAEGQELQLKMEGFYGETLYLERHAVKPGVTHAEMPLRVRVPSAGCVRLSLEALVEREVVARSEVMLTVLPALDPRPRPDSFFGAHGSLGTQGEWHTPTVAARAGVRWWRLHDLSAYTQWAVAEPQPDHYTWFDKELDALRERGLTILGVFARTPAWAGADPGGERTDTSAWPPAKTSDLAEYTRQVAAHYKGRIAAYELWNEPWARASWAGTPERYAEIAKAASQSVREADPKAQLVGGCFWVPQPAFTDRVLAKGLLPAVDAVSHHRSTEPDTVAFRFAGADQVTQWQKGLRGKLDLAGGDKTPIWNTEGGVRCPSYYSWLGAEEQSRAAARTLAKTLILNRAAGIKRYFYYYAWQEMGGPRLFDWLQTNNWALLDYDGSGKPTLSAYAACASSLEGAEPVARRESADVKAYLFKRGNDTVIAAWSPTSVAAPADLVIQINPVRVRAVNVVGNPAGLSTDATKVTVALRNEPIYITVKDTDPDAVQRAIQTGAKPPKLARRL